MRDQRPDLDAILRTPQASLLLALAVLCAGCNRCYLCGSAGLPSRKWLPVTGQVAARSTPPQRLRLAFVPDRPDGGERSSLGVAFVKPDGTFRVDLPSGTYRIEVYEQGASRPRAVFPVVVSQTRHRFQLQVPAVPTSQP